MNIDWIAWQQSLVQLNRKGSHAQLLSCVEEPSAALMLVTPAVAMQVVIMPLQKTSMKESSD